MNQPDPSKWYVVGRHDLRGWMIGLGIALVVTVGIVGYHEVVDPLYLSDNWGEVEKGMIYRSGDPPPFAIEGILREHGIGRIIKLSGHVHEQLHHRKEAEAAEAVGAEMLTVPMPGDGTGTVEAYVEALTLLHEAEEKNTPTLVHCAAGTHRTGGVVAMYRLLIQNAEANDTLAEMTEYDFDPVKHRKLLDHLNAHGAEIARGLRARGLDVRDPNAIPKLGE